MATFVIMLDETEFFFEVSSVYNHIKVDSWNVCKY